MKLAPCIGVLLLFDRCALSASFDAAPFGLPLPEGNGVMWEDPREIHRVVVHFKTVPTAPDEVRLEYWGSRWPEQRLPKDREPGGADVGWMGWGTGTNTTGASPTLTRKPTVRRSLSSSVRSTQPSSPR
jgi:hypothetical protein